MTLGEALASDRSRNLDLLRLVLAASVIISHAWSLALSPGTAEPLDWVTSHSLGGWAIGGFFLISGLLVTASAQRSTPRQFRVARARRIMPGVGVVVLVTLALACVSGSSTNVQEAVTWFARVLTLVSNEHRLTEAFVPNPYPEIINGPLWSLFYEVLAYAICAALVWAGGARKTIVAAMPRILPLQLTILSVLAIYPIALISWYFVERPELTQRRLVF